jgi:hypothetical protein
LNLRAGTENGGISGKITDPQDAPVAEAHLKLVNAAGASVGEAQSDGQGNFRLDSIEPGQYQITAEATSFVSIISVVSVAAGERKEVSLQFQQLVSSLQAVTVVA